MSSDLHQYYLQQMGIETWVLRDTRVSKNAIKTLETAVSTCSRCPLHLTRTQTEFARGNLNAKLMIIGDAPNSYEDEQGTPFLGPAGILLNQMLSSIGLTEEDVYIANVIKCSPPDSRDPLQEEIAQCSRFLTQQLDLIAPKLILAVGRLAGQFLIKEAVPLEQMRSSIHQYAGISVLVTFHPGDLLRNPRDKKKAYEDLISVKKLLVG